MVVGVRLLILDRLHEAYEPKLGGPLRASLYLVRADCRLGSYYGTMHLFRGGAPQEAYFPLTHTPHVGYE